MSLLILPDKRIKQPNAYCKANSRVLFANHRFSKVGISAQSTISSYALRLGIADKFSGSEHKKTSLKLPDGPVTILIGAIQTSQTDYRYLFGTNYDGGLNEALTFRMSSGFLQLTSYNGGTNDVSISAPSNGTYNTYFAELNSIGSSSTTIGYINSSGAITKTSGSYNRLSTAAYDLYIGSGANVSTPWRFYDQPILFTAVFRGKLSDVEKISISKNPWQIFEPDSTPFYFNTTTSGALNGANSNQTNASTAASIAQTHVTSGANSSQSNTSTAASIAQTHVTVGAASDQQNTSSTAEIIAAGALTGANSDQQNTSSSAAISQTHITTGANSSQANASSVAAIIADGSIVLTGANSNQANVSGSAAISQTHIITGSHANQINTSTSAAVNAVYDHLRIAAFSLRLARQAAFQLPINRSMQRSAKITRQLVVPLTLDCHTE